MKFNVNNGRTIEATQLFDDENVYINTFDNKGNKEASAEIMSPGDFITMLNWYRYQKSIGNTNLEF